MSEYTKEVKELLNVLVFRTAQTRGEALRHCKTVKELCEKNKQLQSDLAEAINGLNQKMNKPKSSELIRATAKESVTSQNYACWDIVCEFSDRQKCAPVEVDFNFPELAKQIADFINRNGF